MKSEDARKIAAIIAQVFSVSLRDLTENVVTLESADQKWFVVTVTEVTSPDMRPLPEFDDDGDDDESPADGESFDGGFGTGSYFQRAMRKDD